MGQGQDIDRAVLDQLREDLGPEHLRAAVDLFAKDLRERVGVLRACEGSASVLRAQAHAIKGTAASFGLRRLTAAAADLEAAARRGDPASCAALLDAVLQEAARAPGLLGP